MFTCIVGRCEFSFAGWVARIEVVFSEVSEDVGRGVRWYEVLRR